MLKMNLAILPFCLFVSAGVSDNIILIVLFYLQIQGSILPGYVSEMAKSTLTLKKMGDVFLFLLLISPIPVIGQFVLPFLYMPVKRLFPSDFGSALKYDKATSEHLRTLKGWSLEQTYSENMETISFETFRVLRRLTVANLTDLDYYWSYTIPFDEMNSSLSDSDFAETRTPAEFQQELLAFISKKFVFSIDNVASNLGIPVANLSSSYDPSMWEAVVHAMVSDSSSVFFRLLEIPSVGSLAELVETQDLANANLSRFEHLLFPFLPKKAILDTNITSYLVNSSGIIPGEHYNDVTVAKILQQHVNLTLAFKQFGILYNLTTDQAKAIGRATFSQIVRLCGITTEMILNITLPKLSWKVVGSLFITPPCPALIAIKGKSMASFQRDSVVNSQNTTVLEILTTVSNLSWRSVNQAVNASLPDWEFLDSATLPQLAEVSGVALESLLNDSVSEAVELVFRKKADGTLVNRTETHRAFTRNLLEEKFNLSLSEVANLTGMSEASYQDASTPWLFRSFLSATITYFGLNLSKIASSLDVSEVELYNLPRQEWKSVISAIIDPVLKAEATDLQMSAENLLQFLGVQSVELSLSQLKELTRNQILNAKQKKRKFEIDPIGLYLSRNSVTDANYLNSTVLFLALSASAFDSDELKLVCGYKSDEIFILESMRIIDLPLYCGLNTSAIKARTPHNITAELAGMKNAPAVCKSTRFYIAARYKSMSILQEEFNPFKNASVSYVNLVEMVTGLPWRRNVWAFGLKIEDWTVLYFLSEDTYKNVTTDLNLDPYLSRTLLQIFEQSVQLQKENNTRLRLKKQQHRAPTLNILYELFSTNENELMHFGGKTKDEYNILFPIDVFALAIQYLVGRFNVSLSTLDASLDLRPGNIRKLSPSEWPEMIAFVKAEVIRSGQHQLGVSLFNFAKLLENTPENLSRLTLVQLESKWDSVISRLIKGKAAIETESLLQFLSSMGITCDSLDDVTVLEFVARRINVTKSEMLLLFNYNSIGIDVLGNFTFKELTGFCQLPKGDLCNKRPQQIIVFLLGHNNDMTCRKIASVAAATNMTVDELAAKFSFDVKDNVSLLTMFEEMFNLPWPKIAWAVNASLPNWPILGAMTLSDIAQLTSQTTANMKLQKSFREITVQLLNLPANSYPQLLNTYRSKLVSEASDLFSVNSSEICDGCKLVNVLWNSLTQLSQLVDFDPHMLAKELSVSPYEFNLTVPSQWSPIVAPIIREDYSRAAIALGVDRDRLSTLLQTSTATVQNMTLRQYQAVLSQSIKPLIAAKTALSNSLIADLIEVKGFNLSVIKNENVFDAIDAVLSVSIQNVSFIFNWTAEQQAKLKKYTLDDMSYYMGVGLEQLGTEGLLTLVEYILQRTLPPRTPPPSTLPPCKPGSAGVGIDAQCTGNPEFLLDRLLFIAWGRVGRFWAIHGEV